MRQAHGLTSPRNERLGGSLHRNAGTDQSTVSNMRMFDAKEVRGVNCHMLSAFTDGRLHGKASRIGVASTSLVRRVLSKREAELLGATDLRS